MRPSFDGTKEISQSVEHKCTFIQAFAIWKSEVNLLMFGWAILLVGTAPVVLTCRTKCVVRSHRARDRTPGARSESASADLSARRRSTVEPHPVHEDLYSQTFDRHWIQSEQYPSKWRYQLFIDIGDLGSFFDGLDERNNSGATPSCCSSSSSSSSCRCYQSLSSGQ